MDVYLLDGLCDYHLENGGFGVRVQPQRENVSYGVIVASYLPHGACHSKPVIMMGDRCKRCGAKVIKYPLYEGQEFDERFDLRGKRKLWRNWLRTDLLSVAFFLIVVFLAWAYHHDVAEYAYIAQEPYGFCGSWCEQQCPVALVSPSSPFVDGQIIVGG